MLCGNPIKQVFNYPPKIVERCLQLGLISNQQTISSPRIIALKIIVAIVVATALATHDRPVPQLRFSSQTGADLHANRHPCGDNNRRTCRII